jgi:hypothetical protein
MDAMNRSVIRRSTWAGLAAALILTAGPASAQYKPRPLNDPATGEKYHIEAGGDLWMPTADVTVSSESLNIPGSQINLKRDLGVTDQTFRALQLQLRPSKSHKFRLQYIDVKYEAAAVLSQDIIFNGQAYRLGVPVNSMFDWKTLRFGYEYDFISRNSGFAGFILEAKYTDVNVALDSPFAHEFAQASGPIPALGGIGRVYVVPNISITGELTAFKIPDSIDSRYNAHYVDVDIYGTVNFTNNIGVKGGFRSVDVGYLIKEDTGALTLKGLYFGAVLRY